MARGSVQRKNYLTCSAGKWRERVSESTPGAISRMTTPLDGSPGKVVHEIVDDYVEGEILDIRKQEHDDYGDKWVITIKDGTSRLVLQVRYDSGYAMAMLTKLPNVDITRPVMFLPYYFEDEKKARMVLKQEGIKIPTFYSREDPKGFPPLAEDASKSDVKRWKIDAMEFLDAMVEKVVRPHLPPMDETEEITAYEDRSDSHSLPASNHAGPAADSQDPGPDADDDLPF